MGIDMAGTIEGGRKAAAKNLANDPNFYSKIGRKGGENGNTGGFASPEKGNDGFTGKERARIAGRVGGMTSRRGKPAIKLTRNERKEAIGDMRLSIKLGYLHD